MTNRGSGVINLPPGEGDGEGEDAWSFDWIRRRYGALIEEWSLQAPECGQIRQRMYGALFAQNPQITVRTPQKKHANWTWGGPPAQDVTNYRENDITLFLQWDLNLRRGVGRELADGIREVVRTSSLWNYLNLDDDALGKGDFFHFVLAELIHNQFMKTVDKQGAYQIYQYIADHRGEMEELIRRQAVQFSGQQVQVGKARIEMLNPRGYSGGWVDALGTVAKAIFPYKMANP